VALLIAAGADIDKQDQTCFNPFLISCLTNDLTLLRLVLPANPDLDRLTRFGGVGITPASEKGHVEIVRELLEKPISTSTTPTLSAGRRCWKPSCLTTAARSSRRL
jgi:ankyrin repeat protein